MRWRQAAVGAQLICLAVASQLACEDRPGRPQPDSRQVNQDGKPITDAQRFRAQQQDIHPPRNAPKWAHGRVILWVGIAGPAPADADLAGEYAVRTLYHIPLRGPGVGNDRLIRPRPWIKGFWSDPRDGADLSVSRTGRGKLHPYTCAIYVDTIRVAFQMSYSGQSNIYCLLRESEEVTERRVPI